MASPDNANLLLVEGPDDKHAVARLMERYITWPGDGVKKGASQCPFWIEEYGGVDKLDSGTLGVHWKRAGRRALGVIIDADDNASGRFQSVRGRVQGLVPGLPHSPEPGGLIREVEGKRFGVWVMPDNSAVGMLETFLGCCLKPDGAGLWELVKEVLPRTKGHGAPWRDAHHDKAAVHTYLAWQDPPGNPFGVAILNNVFDTQAALAAQFANWCMKLFDLCHLRSALPAPAPEG